MNGDEWGCMGMRGMHGEHLAESGDGGEELFVAHPAVRGESPLVAEDVHEVRRLDTRHVVHVCQGCARFTGLLWRFLRCVFGGSLRGFYEGFMEILWGFYGGFYRVFMMVLWGLNGV